MGSRCHRRSKRAVFVVLLLAAGCTLHMTLFVLQNSYQSDPADAVSVVNVSSYQGRRLLESEAKLAGCGGGGGGGGGGREEGKRTSYIRLEGVDAAGNDLLVVYGASVAQLKSMCTALPECDGFNSDGWIKGRISSKKRATLDLYVKQVSHLQSSTGVQIWDHDSGVFQSRIADYNEMEAGMKIYIYNTEVGLEMPSYKDYKYGVEYLFISLLSKSKFRTLNPEEASLFFLPARCTAYRKSVRDLAEGIDKAADTMSLMVNDVMVRFPYWNASLGTDHFYICAHDMGTELTKAADNNLLKNAIGLVNTADYSEPMFVPHKDISLPPHPGRGTVDWSLIGQGGANFDPWLRTKLAFMAGDATRSVVRRKIHNLYGTDADFNLVKGHVTDESYLNYLKTSKFCLCPRGFKAWSPRLMDALWFGCIPVFLADHYVPPLFDLIHWDTVSISIPENQVGALKQILMTVPDHRIREMQLSIQKVYKHLTWHDPPQSYDAFHSVLFELWQKRHVRRTHTVSLATETQFTHGPFL